jgi:Flp pilus assembly protein TadB
MKQMEGNILAATLASTSILVGLAGSKFSLSGGSKKKDRDMERILIKAGGRFSDDNGKLLLKKQILQADLDIEPEYFVGLQAALPVMSILVLLPLFMVGLLNVFWLVLLPLVLFFIPRLWLKSKAGARVAQINKDLPDFCVTFAAVLDAGTDFLTAITEVAYSMKGELSKEFLRAVDEMHVGKRRTDALYDMAARVGIPDLTDLVRRIDQAQRYGSPLVEAVKSHVRQIMLRRKYDGHVKAGKLAIRLLPIIMMFILLPMMGLLFFPAGYHILKAFD